MSERGVRDLEWLIDSIDYDYEEDNDEVNGNWRIVRKGREVYVLFEPYGDGSAEFDYPPKASAWVLMLAHVVEGEQAKWAFEEWAK